MLVLKLPLFAWKVEFDYSNLWIADAFNYLDAPLERITGADIPMPYAFNLEALAVPQSKNVVNAVHRVLGKN